MQINTSISAIENLMALINRDNETEVLAEHLEFGVPTEVTEGHGNTAITVTAAPLSPYKGTYDFFYTRLDLADHHEGAVEYVFEEGDTLSSIKADIAAQLGLLDEEVEFDISELDMDDPDGTVECSLRPVADSLIYIGSLAVNIVVDTRTPLDQIFTVSELDGFDLPAEEDPVQG